MARKLDEPTLNDHIPELLEELACELEACSEGSMIEGLKENPVTHELHRLRLGFDGEEVVAEYNALVESELGRGSMFRFTIPSCTE